jgi:hypothetical protein
MFKTIFLQNNKINNEDVKVNKILKGISFKEIRK